ncbi:MAG: FGGY-family carbohydrate kinase [Rhizobiaceae bacterium]|jgi:FGGY-family pentulose kinase
MPDYFMGIDVGTGSARAGIFDAAGQLVGTDKCDITLYREPGGLVEQSSREIWQAIGAASKGALKSADVHPTTVRGVGFDATCSLVVVGEAGNPLSVSPSEDPNRNIIVWMDHRAVKQAEKINNQGHPVLRYVGGKISPEMETPKLLWLKENLPETFEIAWQFFDLVDFLTWRATDSLDRSVCTLTCKWTYLSHEYQWDDSYFESVGLGSLAREGYKRIGINVVEPGTPLANGLTSQAADHLGLTKGTSVGAGLIDAHAGGLGTVGASGNNAIVDTLAYVFGTSSCTMTTTKEPVFVPGVWGPYYSAMTPGTWLLEGGQSATGAAIEQLLQYHPASVEAADAAAKEGRSLPMWLADRAATQVMTLSDVALLANGTHVVPEFLGNRAPHSDPNTRAVIAGLSMDTNVENLVRLYVAGICGIGYGLKQIIKAQADSCAHIKTITISGGAGRSQLVRQLLADTTGVPVATPATQEPVLLGSAILGAVAAGAFSDVGDAMTAMSKNSERLEPAKDALRGYHDARFELFVKFQNLAREAATQT